MIVDLRHVDGSPPVHSADVCMIGAGAAGITMAIELSRRGLSVLVLEAGGFQFEDKSQDFYQVEVVGLPHTGAHDGRFRVFGGTTTRWGGQILELNAPDFEPRAWVPQSGWPFPKSVLDPYYARALMIEGVDSSLLDDDCVWQRVGVEKPVLGGGIEPLFTRFCPQPNFAKLHQNFLATQPGVTVYLHAGLSEILLSPSQNSIQAVRCTTEDQVDWRFTARHFVFCLGGLETPRLLMQPLRGCNAAPWNQSGVLGRYFQDHIDVTAATLLPRDRRWFHLRFDNIYLGGFRYIPKIKANAELQKHLQILSVGASLIPQSARQDVIEEFRKTLHRYQRGELRVLGKEQILQAARTADILARKSWRYLAHRRAYNPDDLGVGLRVHCEQAPNANSRLTLSRERDASGVQRLQLDWRFGQLELETIRKFVEHAARAFEFSGIASVKINGSLAADRTDSYHHMGATRMAEFPHDGVVDPNCQLFGIANGFVCSSSVFPSSGFSNPTHTILALAVRLAEFIAGKPAP